MSPIFRSDGYSGRCGGEGYGRRVTVMSINYSGVGVSTMAVQRTFDRHRLMSRERCGDSDSVAGGAVCSSFRGVAVGAMGSWDRRVGEAESFENRTREYHFVP
jgi:hypothetical protein